jgi:hypothetical protein
LEGPKNTTVNLRVTTKATFLYIPQINDGPREHGMFRHVSCCNMA